MPNHHKLNARFTNQEQQEIAAYYKQHGCMATVRAFDVNRQSLSNILRRTGTPFNLTKGKDGYYRKVTWKVAATIKALAILGKKPAAIASRVGLCVGTVDRVLS